MRLIKNYVPFRILRETHGCEFQLVYFKSGLTGWINKDGTYAPNSYPRVKRYLSAYYGYAKDVHNADVAFSRNGYKTSKAKEISTYYKKANNKIINLINTSAHSHD